MSPTSYQTAPPRDGIPTVALGARLVKVATRLSAILTVVEKNYSDIPIKELHCVPFRRRLRVVHRCPWFS